MEKNTYYLNDDEMEINLGEIFYALLHKWYIIALSGMVCALVVFQVTMFWIPEKFVSKTSIYIYNQQNENMTYNDLQTGSTLTMDYEILVKSRNVLENVIEKLELEITYKKLHRMVSVSVPSNTRIVEISVETEDPYLSRDIADSVREISSKNIAEVMGVDAVNVVEKANFPEGKSSPNVIELTLIGAIAGIFIASGIIIFLTIFNDTICTQDDVEKYLDLSTLGIIPLDDALISDEKKRKKTKKIIRKIPVPKRVNI